MRKQLRITLATMVLASSLALSAIPAHSMMLDGASPTPNEEPLRSHLPRPTHEWASPTYSAKMVAEGADRSPEDLPQVLKELYTVAGVSRLVSEAQLVDFGASLDPRLTEELIPILNAFTHALTLQEASHRSSHPIDLRMDAGIVLLDAISSHRTTLQELPMTVWPETKIADPVGLIAIGGSGDDTYEKLRWLQIDPAGDDRYENNAGGGYILLSGVYHPEEIYKWEIPVALSWDLAGDDTYCCYTFAQGSGHRAVGVLVDEAGDDGYSGAREMQGSGFEGVGIFHDKGGNDTYACSWGYCQGFSARGVGIFQDDWGNDTYFTEGAGQGAALVGGRAVFEDLDGSDVYDADSSEVLGYALEEGRAFFNDTGGDPDRYIFYDNTFAENGACWFRDQYTSGPGYAEGCDDG